MKNLIFESLKQFTRGSDSKSSLNIGLYHEMPAIAKKLKEQLEYDEPQSGYQYYAVDLANHEAYPKNTVLTTKNPVFMIQAAFTSETGLDSEDSRYILLNLYVDPIDMNISAGLTIDFYDGTDRSENYETSKEPISNLELSELSRHISRISDQILDQAEIKLP